MSNPLDDLRFPIEKENENACQGMSSLSSQSIRSFEDALSGKYSREEASRFQKDVMSNFENIQNFQNETLENFDYIDDIRSMTWQLASQYGTIMHKEVVYQRDQLERSSKHCLIVSIISCIALLFASILIISSIGDNDALLLFGVVICLVELFCFWVSTNNNKQKLFLNSLDAVASDIVNLNDKLKLVDSEYSTKGDK